MSWGDYFTREMNAVMTVVLGSLDPYLCDTPSIGEIGLAATDVHTMTIEELESAYVGEFYP